MRMTNKIMRNNSLYNINQNKILEDKLSNQMTNQSKITRPSDDPVVAIRALRLRTNVTTVTQYYDKNAPDADSWLTITGDALNTVGSVLKNLYEQVEDASKKSLKSEDLEIIMTQMEALTKEFYASGNVDYAGRYVFSGFRTDTPITFRAEDIKEFTKDPENPKTYVITESMGYHDILTANYTDWSAITKDAAGNPVGDENAVTNTKIYRFRMSYDELDLKTDANGNIVDLSDVFAITDKDGNPMTVTAYKDADSAYKAIAAYEEFKKQNPTATTVPAGMEAGIAYIADTGELAFGENYYNDSIKENTQITVKYAKSTWQEGDINPVHYFHCIATDKEHTKDAMDLEGSYADLDTKNNTLASLNKDMEAARARYEEARKKNDTAAMATELGNINTLQPQIDAAQADVDVAQAVVNNIKRNVIEYNLDGKDQDIYYNVGFNQTIQVNTHADEVFTHGAQRDMDDFKIYLKQLQDAEAKISDIENKMKEYAEDTPMYKELKLQLDGMNKAYTYIRDNVQTKFENQITRYQKYVDDTNVAVTNNGTRGSRLDLISDRLMNQKATFKDLQSNNEDVDVTEVAVQLKSSELAYEASLMATSKIMQTNLMNYI